MATEVLIKGRVGEVLPQGDVDGGRDGEPFRTSRYGELGTMVYLPGKAPHALEGTYFVTQNPVFATALAAAVVAAFADTSAFFAIYNDNDRNQALSAKLILEHIKMAFTVAPASATGMRYALVLDDKDRAPTAGSVLLAGAGGTPGMLSTGPKVGSSNARIYSFTGGVQMTVPARGANARIVAHGGIDGIPVVGGERVIRFGSDALSNTSSQAPPVVIPPGWWAVVHIWFPGNAATGASVEPEIALIER